MQTFWPTFKNGKEMKRLYFVLFTFAFALSVAAQPNKQQQQFSPERFNAELQEFITKEAKLTPQEAAKFFPIYKEMQQKQRALFERQKQLGMAKPEDEKACEKAIRERDEIELELKRIQQTYHKKFLEILPASKVYDILQAENRFHRRMLRKWSNPGNHNNTNRNMMMQPRWPQFPQNQQKPQK